ncbi:protein NONRESPONDING TO OXYLIPINS 2, mitochondrial isoform X2 [Rhododendron vialii]|uniref:protein NONRESPONDING TO OXYLIPINS 2, mitochondrial isoform X2 n=1 Tax=Rhododendron vialii TaxID=182163 RepID=UPI00265EA6B1|nr:protein NONRESPONDING TO OXYLIPINS 2, mitochondrial isoform X2 [Rhododendron vialii]
MASACRSAVMAGARSVAARSKTPLLKNLLSPKSSPPSPFSSSTRSSAASRIAAVLGSVESMMPLHSVIASARLRSSIAVDSTCWSLLSQGLKSVHGVIETLPKSALVSFICLCYESGQCFAVPR